MRFNFDFISGIFDCFDAHFKSNCMEIKFLFFMQWKVEQLLECLSRRSANFCILLKIMPTSFGFWSLIDGHSNGIFYVFLPNNWPRHSLIRLRGGCHTNMLSCLYILIHSDILWTKERNEWANGIWTIAI